ncbi:DNA primase family protein [Palleronia aestuarii]|uniref:DNA primase family protein n=1 Tax=Palleronia aestuarii TaxID=568105 RepID=UPI0014766D10|nr:DNA primase family protein [Palleronia aestuarii]
MELPEAACANFPLNDIGNGQRFVTYFGSDVIRVSRVGWFVWTEKVWKKDQEDGRGFSPLVRALAQQISTKMAAEVPFIPINQYDRALLSEEDGLVRRHAELRHLDDPDAETAAELAEVSAKMRRLEQAKKMLGTRRREYHAFAKSTGNKARIDALLTEGSVSLSHAFDELDAESLEVNTGSGVLAFGVTRGDGMGSVADVRLRPHDRSQLMTKIMPVDYDDQARSPLFDAFLERVQPNPEMRAFLQRWFGLNLTSITGDQKLAFFYGEGANGKSVLTDLMARMMGDYAATARIESLTGTNRRGGGDATPDLIPLMGARMVRASEPEQGTKLQEGVIKELTGGEPLLVRALHSDFVEVKPQFKLTISGNHKPDIRGTDDGIWRRVMLIPFLVQIPEAERDPDLLKKLWEERSGILNWMVAGLIDYLEGGLQVPKEVTEATQGYREDSDPIGVFLADCCEVTGSEQHFTRSKELVEAFHFWMDERGETQWTSGTVTKRLKDRAKRYRDPRTGRTFQAAKRSIAGYLGVKLADIFEKRLRDAGGSSGLSRGSSSPSSTSPDPF